MHSPRVLSPPRALLDSPHHHLPASPHDGHRGGRALLDSPHHHLPSSPHHGAVGGHHLPGASGSPHHVVGHHLPGASPHHHRGTSTCDSPRRYIGSPLRVASRPHSPDLQRAAASPINLHNFHRDAFDSPARPDAWSPPPYESEAVSGYPASAHAYLAHHHRTVRHPSLSPPPLRPQDHLHLSPRRPPAAHYSHQVNSQVRRQTQLFRCPPLLSCHESPFLWTSWISSKESLLTLRSPLSTTLDQPPLLPRSFTKLLRGGVDH